METTESAASDRTLVNHDNLDQRIPGYRILRHIAGGGMADVHLAVESSEDTGRLVAVKILKRSFSDDPGALRKFTAEARLIGQFRHHNIVREYAHGAAGDSRYIVMEYLPNGTLHERLGHGTLTGDAAHRIALALASALEYAHARQVVHRDLKPKNVLFSDDDAPVLSDFGIAKFLGEERLEHTGAWGTIAYMAPEQWRGEKVTPATDVYALGLLMFDMFVDRIPPPERPRSGDAINLSELPRDARWVSGIISSCLHESPGMRAMATEVRTALAGFTPVASPADSPAAPGHSQEQGPTLRLLSSLLLCLLLIVAVLAMIIWPT